MDVMVTFSFIVMKEIMLIMQSVIIGIVIKIQTWNVINNLHSVMFMILLLNINLF
jgi:hypothetical protein